MDNVVRAPKDAYSKAYPWWRVRVTQEMYDGITNLLFFYYKLNVHFPKALLRHRMSLVVLLDKAQNIN